jgi:hypothetical protein
MSWSRSFTAFAHAKHVDQAFVALRGKEKLTGIKAAAFKTIDRPDDKLLKKPK